MAVGHGSKARANTGSLSSIKSIPANSERTSPPRTDPSWRAWIRFQISYSINRLDTNSLFQKAAEGTRDSASKYASATELSI